MGQAIGPKRIFKSAVVLGAAFRNFTAFRCVEHHSRFPERRNGVEMNTFGNATTVSTAESFASAFKSPGAQVGSCLLRSCCGIRHYPPYGQETPKGLGSIKDIWSAVQSDEGAVGSLNRDEPPCQARREGAGPVGQKRGDAITRKRRISSGAFGVCSDST